VVVTSTEVSSSKVIWHDLECGSYRADLPLWRELAGAHDGPVLDIGAGTGRVALDLARAGHRVTALDLDIDLLTALRDRAGHLDVEIVCADARLFDLDRSDFSLCLVPMQTIQLLDSSEQRIACLRRARAHLRPGGLIACAIVTALEPFDCARGDLGPTPETVRVGDMRYASRATKVQAGRTTSIERERRTVGPGDQTVEELDIVELARLTVPQLEREGTETGLRAETAHEIPPTGDHVGSSVVMFRG
jgi:SAM-dependent methyltransferase